MEHLDRLKLLSSEMHLEADGHEPLVCEPVISPEKLKNIPISEAQMPNGKRIKLLKTMVTSACERNCYYCPFRAGRDLRRATFKPEELAHTFLKLHKAQQVEGMFLSSGIIGGGMRTQDKLLDTADILRNKLGYRGYLHLKIMPGAERAQVERAMQLASRISINLEAPNTKRLQALAPLKMFTEELLQPLKWAEEIRQNQAPYRTWNGRWPSSTTQFVVGAVGESDLELLATSEYLIRQASLKRVYFSAFSPIQDTPLENHTPTDPLRQHRLYQSSYLLRDYGFSLEDMPFDPSGNLPLGEDPKLAWAKSSLQHAPVEVNRANRQQLLQIPGIGPKGATAILNARRTGNLRELGDLNKLGIIAKRAAPFILLDGKRPAYQLQML
ncbi:MAG: radical SAM protein [Anaerolineales bacterium]|nr:radical SAM protein [Anaerolineales bacterium]